jgi:hypothetical protein
VGDIFFAMKSMKDMKDWFTVYPDAPPDTEALHFLTQRSQRRGEIWVSESRSAQWGILNLFTQNKERIDEYLIHPFIDKWVDFHGGLWI